MLKICFVSTEVAPYSKTGGLGDVVEGLPEELAKMGHQVCTIAPRFDQYSDAWDTQILQQVTYGKETTNVRYFHTVKEKEGVDHVWVDHHVYLSKTPLVNKKLYGPQDSVDYADNAERFAMLCQAALAVPLLVPLGAYGNKGPMGEETIFCLQRLAYGSSSIVSEGTLPITRDLPECEDGHFAPQYCFPRAFPVVKIRCLELARKIPARLVVQNAICATSAGRKVHQADYLRGTHGDAELAQGGLLALR